MSHAEATRHLSEPFGVGGAFVETIPGASPTAGSGFSLPQDGRFITRPLFVAFRLVTDANVANRVATVDFTDGNGNVYAQNGAAFVVAAGATNDYRFAHQRTVAEWTSTGPVFAPLAEDYLQPGEQLQINIQNIQVGDQISRVFLRVERYMTGPRGPLGEHHRHPRFAIAGGGRHHLGR